MNIMNILERHKLLSRVPKEKRSELKMIMSRTNFHEIRDVGNEEYVLNVINQDNVVDKVDTEGHLYLMCASSRFEIKMLRYQMKFGEKNEIIVLKDQDAYLTDAEEAAWDRYVAEFCAIIKRELDYQVVYTSEVVVKPVQEQVKTQNTSPVNEVVLHENNETNTSTMNANKVTPFSLEQINKAVASTGEGHIVFTVYARNGEFGVGIDAGKTTIGDVKIIKASELETENVVRAISSAVALAQSLGSYLRLMNSNIDISYYLFKDRDVYIDIPAMFEVITAEDLAAASN